MHAAASPHPSQQQQHQFNQPPPQLQQIPTSNYAPSIRHAHQPGDNLSGRYDYDEQQQQHFPAQHQQQQREVASVGSYGWDEREAHVGEDGLASLQHHPQRGGTGGFAAAQQQQSRYGSATSARQDSGQQQFYGQETENWFVIFFIYLKFLKSEFQYQNEISQK